MLMPVRFFIDMLGSKILFSTNRIARWSLILECVGL